MGGRPEAPSLFVIETHWLKEGEPWGGKKLLWVTGTSVGWTQLDVRPTESEVLLLLLQGGYHGAEPSVSLTAFVLSALQESQKICKNYVKVSKATRNLLWWGGVGLDDRWRS